MGIYDDQMMVSEVLSKLQDVLNEHGDMPVWYWESTGNFIPLTKEDLFVKDYEWSPGKKLVLID